MKILVAHTFYQQAGGEDTVFKEEVQLLRHFGHEVATYTRANDEITVSGLSGKLQLAANTIWSHESRKQLGGVLDREKPDLVHFHNTFPLMSPSVYAACKERDIAVVQTLHNFRLICPSAALFREGSPCELCVGGSPWKGVLHKCYRSSRTATAAIAAMISFNRLRETWTELVDQFIVCSQFARNKFILGGLPAETINVKPNFVYPDPGLRNESEHYAVFAGRLAEEKGLRTLLEAWVKIGSAVPLKIIGDGPLRQELEQYCRDKSLTQIHFLGRLPHSAAIAEIRKANFLVFPSECYEGFPMTIVEAFAAGVPVIASRIGSVSEILRNGHNGLTFCAADARSLADQVLWALAHSNELEEMGRGARSDYEQKYSAEKNYQLLTSIYARALKRGVSISEEVLFPMKAA